jgi:hypothetical protein
LVIKINVYEAKYRRADQRVLFVTKLSKESYVVKTNTFQNHDIPRMGGSSAPLGKVIGRRRKRTILYAQQA